MCEWLCIFFVCTKKSLSSTRGISVVIFVAVLQRARQWHLCKNFKPFDKREFSILNFRWVSEWYPILQPSGWVKDHGGIDTTARISENYVINTLRPRQNGRHLSDDIFERIFLNENVWISINISLKFVPRGQINNIPTLVQVMAWRRAGDKPLSEPMMVRLPTHICVTRPQWFKSSTYTPNMRWQWGLCTCVVQRRVGVHGNHISRQMTQHSAIIYLRQRYIPIAQRIISAEHIAYFVPQLILSLVVNLWVCAVCGISVLVMLFRRLNQSERLNLDLK